MEEKFTIRSIRFLEPHFNWQVKILKMAASHALGKEKFDELRKKYHKTELFRPAALSSCFDANIFVVQIWYASCLIVAYPTCVGIFSSLKGLS